MSHRTSLDHAMMMKDEDRWPIWPRLPVKHVTKREGSFPVMGILFAGQGPKVFVVNMYDEITEETKTEEFASFEALAVQWEVD